jgi:hypothetical protein
VPEVVEPYIGQPVFPQKWLEGGHHSAFAVPLFRV